MRPSRLQPLHQPAANHGYRRCLRCIQNNREAFSEFIVQMGGPAVPSGWTQRMLGHALQGGHVQAGNAADAVPVFGQVPEPSRLVTPSAWV